MPQTVVSIPSFLVISFSYNTIQNQAVSAPLELYKVSQSGNSCTYTEVGQTQINLTKVNFSEYKANSDDSKDAFYDLLYLKQTSVYCRSNYDSEQENPRLEIKSNQIRLI